MRGTHAALRGVHVTQREQTAIYKPRREPCGEGSPADTLISKGLVSRAVRKATCAVSAS